MKKIIMILTCILSLFSRAAFAIDPVSLPFTYSGITFNQAFAFTGPSGVHVCYFKNPTHSLIEYPNLYYGVESDAMYSPDGSCGGTYLSHNTRLITFVTNPPYCAECGIIMSCPLSQNTWSSSNMSAPDWWPTTGTNICGILYYPGNNLYPANNPPEPQFLSFPLGGYTAYSAPVSSVMDQGTLGSGIPYSGGRNGVITIFNNESGDAETGCHCYSTGLACNSSNYSSCAVPGYLKFGGGSWLLSNIINYTGNFLYYDAHPGYDYPQAQGTAILAPAGGTLCVATSTISQQTPSEPWRNTTQCPLASAPGTSSVNWTGYHAFYILHGPMFINGLTDEYMTVFLHNNNLESTVLSGIYNDGYKVVTRLQEVAAVGDVGASGAYHVHLEVYKKVSGNWTRVDPYGDGTNNILWQH